MHEVAVAQRLVKLMTDAAAGAGGGRVVSGRLVVGQLTCIEPDALAFGFEIAARGTAAAGARLEIVPVPLRMRCRTCAAERGGEIYEPCPCGAVGAEVLAGRELRLESIEVDEASKQGTRAP
jgi:hydrogenase nickel incorporation protein HypA/HybF